MAWSLRTKHTLNIMDSFNPFQSDEIKNLILEKEGKKAPDNYEIVNGEDNSDLKSIISGKPIIPQKAKNLILDASALAKNEREEKAIEVRRAINDVFTSYNEQYGLDLEIDLNSMSNTLVNIADEKNRKVLENYLSLYYKGIKPILILHLLSRLTLAIDYITAPERLFNSDLSTADIFIVIEKLMSYIQDLQAMKKEIEVNGDSMELRKIAEESKDTNSEFDDPESRAVIDDFMKLFQAEHKK